jgi:hypothetical protein
LSRRRPAVKLARVESGSTPSEAPDAGYAGAAVAGAVLATLFFPLIALIAALLLQGSQPDPRKKAQLHLGLGLGRMDGVRRAPRDPGFAHDLTGTG